MQATSSSSRSQQVTLLARSTALPIPNRTPPRPTWLVAGLLLLCLVAALFPTFLSAQGVQSSPIQQLSGENAARPLSDAAISLPQAPNLTPPAGAEGLSFEVGSIRIMGGVEALNARALASAPQAGAIMSITQLYDYASALQRLYLEEGYPLVRVLVPAQDIQPRGSQVRILVVNGFIETIDTGTLHPRVRGQIAQILSPLLKDENVTAKELERRILLAGDTAGVRLRTALAPGEAAGGVTLVANGDFKSFDGVISIDNRVLDDLGREQITLSTAFNSLLGGGEQIVLTTATSLEDPGIGTAVLRSFMGLTASAPIGRDGITLGANAIYASNAPAETVTGLRFDNEFWRIGINASYALVRTRRASSTLTLGFDASSEEQRVDFAGIQAPLFKDRIRVLRFGIAGYTRPGPASVLNYDLHFSQGINILGARSASDASVLLPLSRDGSDTDFSKLEAGVSVLHEVTEALRLHASLRGQTGFGNPLMRSEQASFTTPGLLSGPPPGSVVGDRMAAARLEVQSPKSVSDSMTVEPYSAVATGHSRLERPTAFELPESDANAFGLGLRSLLSLNAKVNLSAQIEWMRITSDDQRLDDDWLTFAVALRF